MAFRRMTLAEAQARMPDVDRAMMETTTEEDIRRHKIEDGADPDIPTAGRLVVPAASVRNKLGMSESEFASLIGVPIDALRDWEQGRVVPDPAARSLLVILWREPTAALRALRAA